MGKTHFERLKDRYYTHNVAKPHKKDNCSVCKEWNDFHNNPLSNMATSNMSRLLQQSKSP